MTESLHRRDRLPVMVSYLSPFVGLPLLGPWLMHATLPDTSPAKAHVARAFDLHLAMIVLTVASLVTGLALFGDSGAVLASGGVLLVAMILDIVLLVSACRGGRMSAPWLPVVLGRRTFYEQQPFVR